MAAIINAAAIWQCFVGLILGVIVVVVLWMSNISLPTTKHLPTTFQQLSSQFSAVSSLEKVNAQYEIAEQLRNISRNVKVPGVSCEAIFNGDKNETKTALGIKNNVSMPLSDSFYLNLTTDCVEFQRQRGYIMSTLTKVEEQFPLAYSIMVFKDSEMVERLLRAIYRPQNVYCIHIDIKSQLQFFQTISAIANCFPNVFMASRRFNVEWGTFTVLESELVCMEELWRYKKWKYFINLTGQEFPLKTNYELVKILTAYNGAVDVRTTVKYAQAERWYNTTAPRKLKHVKGAVHILVNRAFVGYILNNDTAHELLNWTKKTWVPDETFFAILNANPQLGIKGTYKGNPENSATRPFLARFKIWGYSGRPCARHRYVRGICIITSGDLWQLHNATQMFANKFYLQEDRVAIGCLEEKHYNNTRDEYLGTKIFNTTYYENLDFVRNKVE